MQYISTRDNYPPVQASGAISLGMVPVGGLFVPETIPRLDPVYVAHESYAQTARRVFAPLLTDFTDSELIDCIARAYNSETFDSQTIANLVPLDHTRSVLELWHGPTAAFKDVALQIMPHFMNTAKRKLGNRSHTVILVATSGDTGKAALEGFKNCEGISIIVFYPDKGVSEIQKLQMTTTDGNNTYVVAVRGNFDDCQTGVKNLFSDTGMRSDLASRGFEFSSANSINWGRLSPQIVYYFQSYANLVEHGTISPGEYIDFCVPTGNFGNILAGYYAKLMGLPIERLICASNRNRILFDFFTTGIYDRNREFYRTMSPSMDILISSNLERFLHEITGHDAVRLRTWYDSLESTGTFEVDSATRSAMDKLIVAGWVDEQTVLDTIGRVYRTTGYVLDTHTAVGVAVSDTLPQTGRHTVIASTASPFKFSCEVLDGMNSERNDDEFACIERIGALSGMPVHRALRDLRQRPVRHDRVIDIEAMKDTVRDIVATIGKPFGVPG